MADAGNRAHLGWLRQIAYDADLTPFAMRVAVALTRYFNRATGDAYPSQETLAADLSASSDGVRKAVIQLEAAGHLQVIRGRGRTNHNRYRPVTKTPTASGGKSAKNPDSHLGIASAENPDRQPEKPRQPSEKTPLARPPIPLMNPSKEPLEREEALRRVNVVAQQKAERRESKARLCDAWSPPRDAYEFGAELGLSVQEIEFETAKFRDHAIANDRRQADWAGAWRNWMRKAVEFRAQRRPPQTRQSALDWAVARIGDDER